MFTKSKVAVMFSRSRSAGLYSCFFAGEISQLYSPAVNVDVCLPNFVAAVKRYACNFGGTVGKYFPVLHALTAIAFPKIFLAVVERVVVSVVTELPAFATEDYAVHHWSAMCGACVKRVCTFVPVCVPETARETDNIIIVHNGNLATSQFNFGHICNVTQ